VRPEIARCVAGRAEPDSAEADGGLKSPRVRIEGEESPVAVCQSADRELNPNSVARHDSAGSSEGVLVDGDHLSIEECVARRSRHRRDVVVGEQR